MARRPRSKLTAAQEAFIEAKMEGKSDHAAAKEAGYRNARGLVTSETVKTQLAAARRWLTDATQIKRLDIVEGIIDGIEIARMQADAGNVIKGWVEIAKILGHTAPEVKVNNMTINQVRVRSKFEALSDAELIAIAEGRVIDGEAETVQ